MEMTTSAALKTIKVNARKGKATIPTLDDLQPVQPSSFTDQWPLLVFHNEVNFATVSFDGRTVIIEGDSLEGATYHTLIKHGLLQLEPLFDTYTRLGIVKNTVGALVDYLIKHNLELSRLHRNERK